MDVNNGHLRDREKKGAGMTIGKRLRSLRTAHGLTQRDLAAPKFTNAYVSSIERGHRKPSRQAVEYFASKLGVSVEEILTGASPDLAPRLELRLIEARVSLSSGHLTEAERSLRFVAKEASRHHLPTLEAGAEVGLGIWLERQGRPEEALEHFDRAEKILDTEPVTSRVDAVAGKARCFHSLGDIRYEIHLLESLLASIASAGLHDPDALARVHAGLVHAYVEAGLYKKASISAAELDVLEPRLSDPSRIAQMHMSVARLYLVQDRVPDALRSLQRAEDAYRQVELKVETGYAHLARGYVLSREGRLDEARRQLEEARNVFEETGDEKDLIRALNELARVERLEGNPTRARELLERSIALVGTNDAPILAWARRELGLVLAEFDPPAAEKNLRTAIELYELSEQTVDIAVTYRALGDILRARGNEADGYEAYRVGILALEPHL